MSVVQCVLIVTMSENSFYFTLGVFVSNSKILTMHEAPSSDQKGVDERLSKKNGDVGPSTEKLSNGPDAASSMSRNMNDFMS